MSLVLSYTFSRLSSRLHRLRLALHARGWRGLLSRVAGGSPHGAGLTRAATVPAVQAPAVPRGPRVLVIDVTTPRPDRDSGSMRARRLMALLVALGYRVEFLPDDGRDAGAYTAALEADGVLVHLPPGGRQRLHWLRQHAPAFAAVVVSRYHLAEPLFPLLRRIAPATRLVLDTVDLHHLREQREADRDHDAKLARLAAITRRRELAMIARADTTWVVSAHERDLLARDLPAVQVEVVSNLHEAAASVPGPEARTGMLFVGGAGHPPNVDAVRWLVEHLFPAVAEALPALQLHLVGEGLERHVQGAPPGVIVHGHVPDLEPLLQRMRLAVAPLRFGAGVKGKVNLGLAHGLPMVVTACAAEGLHIVDGEHALLAETPEAFAHAVTALCRDDALWSRLSSAGRALIDQHFTAASAREAVLASLPPPEPVS